MKMQKQILSLGIALTLFLYLAPHAWAQETVNHYLLGQQYFTEKKFDAAYTELYLAFLEDPGNLDLNFLLGRAAFESGRYEEAIMAYDRILMADPEASRVKLELARAHLSLGSKEIAKQFFREVLATNPPAQVWQNIEKFLAAIEESEKKHFFTGTFSLGANRDDNVRLAPIDERISIGLFEFLLTGPTASPQRDQVYNTLFILNHIYKPETKPYVWKTSLTNYNAFYESQHDLDTNFLGLTSGAVWQGSNYLIDLQALVSHVEVEYERYQSSYGATSSGTLFLLPNLLVTASMKAEEKNNYTDNNRDAFNTRYTVGPTLLVGKNRLNLNFAKEFERAESALNSYDRFAWQLTYDRELPYDMNFSASIGYTDSDYRKMDELFNVFRSDEVQDITFSLSKPVWQAKTRNQVLIAQLGHTYTDSQSNIDLYHYKKNVTSLSLTYNF